MVRTRARWSALGGLVVLLAGCGGDDGATGEPPVLRASLAPTGLPAATVPALRVATFNVRRLFDTVCDSDECGGSAWEVVPTHPQFRARIATLADAIERLDAHLVLLQEIENERCLTALAEALAPRYPVAVLAETGGSASIDVAVLGEGRLLAELGHRKSQPLVLSDGRTELFSRELLEVHLDWHGVHVVAFVAHFRSKVNDDPARREAEGAMAHQIVVSRARRTPGALVVLGGDLNDTPGSPTLAALEHDGLLTSVSRDLGDEAGTYTWDGERIAIDHLLVAHDGSGAYLEGSAEVFRDGFGGLGDSDHAALRATFAVPAPVAVATEPAP